MESMNMYRSSNNKRIVEIDKKVSGQMKLIYFRDSSKAYKNKWKLILD